MTDEELRARAIQELEFYKKDDTFMLADITVDLAIKALKQMPVITTTGEGGVIYYPQVEGVTPTVIDAGKQEPCDTCGYEEGSIYCKEHCPHEAKEEQELRICKTCIHSDKGHCAGTEVCHECMLEDKYEQQPCSDAISRENAIIRISWDFPTLEISKVKESLDKLPSVTPQPKTGHWIPVYQGDEIINYRCSECELGDTNGSTNLYGWDYCRRCGARMIEPQESEEE